MNLDTTNAGDEVPGAVRKVLAGNKGEEVEDDLVGCDGCKILSAAESSDGRRR